MNLGPATWDSHLGQRLPNIERHHRSFERNRTQLEGGVMVRWVTRGCFTRDYAKGLVAAPEDREPAVRKLFEGAGCSLLSFYITTGDTDFMVISEASESES